jgi:hypothetical protein
LPLASYPFIPHPPVRCNFYYLIASLEVLMVVEQKNLDFCFRMKYHVLSCDGDSSIHKPANKGRGNPTTKGLRRSGLSLVHKFDGVAE